jgi:flavin-dependent dehydrogenase
MSRRALIVGGGFAGLCAARALAGRGGEVVILERDRLPDGPEVRPGVPQARHVHVLLSTGAERLEAMFPRILDELAAAGAPHVDFAADLRMLGPFGWLPRYTSPLRSRVASRALLESVVRARVAAVPGVAIRDEANVSGLVVTGGVVRGAVVNDEPLEADLVVDASGRACRHREWLQAAGVPPVPELVVDAQVGYASRVVEPPDGRPFDWRMLFLMPQLPGTLRGGAIFAVEGGRWIVTLAGYGKDYPPTDEEGFTAFARSLRAPDLADALEGARPLTPISGNRNTVNRMRMVHKVKGWPRGLLALGDAVCTFNPIYGQGMTVAMLEALALAETLDAGEDDLEARFHRRAARVVSPVWDLAVGSDLRVPSSTGKRPALFNLVNRHLDGLFTAAVRDERVALTLLEVLHLRRPSSALLSPGLLWTSLRTTVDLDAERA